MKRLFPLLSACVFGFAFAAAAQASMEQEVIPSESGDLKISFVGHGTLMFEYSGKAIHVDPWSRLADYSSMPKADVILITHEHHDHLDLEAIKQIQAKETQIIAPAKCADKIKEAIIMNNGDTKSVAGLEIEAIPAYNLVHMRSEGVPFHIKGEGNGYVATFGEKRVYVAGDTENIPEMSELKDIDIAFLPMNLPYTMTPEMVAAAAKAFKPRILYPYHYGETDTSIIVELLKDEEEIEVRIRPMR